MAAGEISRALNIPHNTMSSHLSVLVNAGLAESQREGRSIRYSIDFDGTHSLLTFLVEDCCQGRPEDCTPLLDSVLPGCCDPSELEETRSDAFSLSEGKHEKVSTSGRRA